AAVVVLVGGGSTLRGKTSQADKLPAIRGQAFLSPTSYQFGDTIKGRVEVLLDARRVKPADVKLNARFFPYVPVAGTARAVRSAGPLTLVTYSVRLRCLGIACLPRVFPLHLQFAPAHVVYRAGKTSGSLQLTWPPLLLFS